MLARAIRQFGDTYTAALESSTQSLRTQWPHEQSGVPPIQAVDRARYQKWLESMDFPAASNTQVWEAIKTNWISFLSATGTLPADSLSPRRKVVTWGPPGPETPQDMTKRFKQDRWIRHHIQVAAWAKLDGLQVLAERWPVPIRTFVNQAGGETEEVPFESWAAKMNLNKRRRGDSVLTGLLCFLVYSCEAGTFEEMGLFLSEDVVDDILDMAVAESLNSVEFRSSQGSIVALEEAIGDILARQVTDPMATARTNALLWWVCVLVQSSLSTSGNDYISQGRFDLNIFTMDMDIRERLEALLHYSKLLVLDLAMQTWQPSTEHLREVQDSMRKIDLQWLNADDDQRPLASVERSDNNTTAWKDITGHIQRQSRAFLGEQPGTVARQLRMLLQEEQGGLDAGEKE
jgi:hypothetical protein